MLRSCAGVGTESINHGPRRMTRRTSHFEEFMEIASRLPWRVSIVIALLSATALHAMAIVLSPSRSAPALSDLGAFATHSLLASVATLLQFIVPAAFLIGAIASYLRRSQASGLLESARAGGRRLVEGMTWVEFERLVAETFRQRGYNVTETGGRTADGGVDLALTKGKERLLVQCKQWRARSVGVTVIRELYGIIAASRATGGYVVTSGMFTHDAKQFARSCSIELIDGDGLESLIRDLNRKQTDENHSENTQFPSPKSIVSSDGSPTCPGCGSIMKMRMAKRGVHAGQPFWGCSRFPACRITRPISAAT